MDDLSISTYVINLPERKDRLLHILDQFRNRPEFDLHIVEASKNAIGAKGLWKSIVRIIHSALHNQDDVIVICEDDHQFTEFYSKEYLFENILQAYKQNCDLLCGGISGGYSYVLPLSKNRFWIDSYWCNQFIILFSCFFQIVLNHQFDVRKKVDQTLSSLSNDKMVIYPFISTQKYFGYSDVTKHNNDNPEWARNRFNVASGELSKIQKLYMRYYDSNCIFPHTI